MLPPENAGSIVRAAPINVIGMLRHHLAPSHDNNFLWKQNEVVDGQRVQESTSWEMVQFIGANLINGFMGRVIDTAIQARFCNKPVTVVF